MPETKIAKGKALEEEKKRALLELSIALSFFLAFIGWTLAANFLQEIEIFHILFPASALTETLMNSVFLLLTLLVWLTYRRWREAVRTIKDLEEVIAHINPYMLLELSAGGLILRSSPSVEKTFGYRPEELMGEKADFLYELQGESSPAEPEGILENKRYQLNRGVGKKKTGERISLEVITAKLRDGKGSVVLLRNTSDQKAFEGKLLQQQKLEALGSLAGGIAHDYNNFMTVISGFAKVMKRRMPPADPLRFELEELLKAAERATSLTRQLLAFSRRQTSDPKVVNLNEVILDMSKILRFLVGEDIELVIIPAQNLGAVRVDVTQVEQVLLNLVLNARHAMPAGGKIVIETHNITNILLQSGLEASRARTASGDYVMLNIKDSGVGMTKDVQKHLFQPFFTTKEKTQGVGLGLASCYSIVQQNQGDIFISSEPGKGTTVSIYFPQAKESVEALPVSREPESLPEGTETIFLIEDEPTVRTFAARVLRGQGYQVIEAGNGLEALSFIEQHPETSIDLLLTDVVMPRMGGEELAQKLEISRPHLRVIYTSGYVDETGLRGKLNHAAFLPKPFSPESLVFKVREVLNGA